MMTVWTKVVAMTRIEIYFGYTATKAYWYSKRGMEVCIKWKKELNVIPAVGVGNKVDGIPL